MEFFFINVSDLTELWQGHLTDDTRWKAPYNHVHVLWFENCLHGYTTSRLETSLTSREGAKRLRPLHPPSPYSPCPPQHRTREAPEIRNFHTEKNDLFFSNSIQVTYCKILSLYRLCKTIPILRNFHDPGSSGSCRFTCLPITPT